MKKIKYVILTVLITTLCCANIIPINAHSNSKDDRSTLEEAKNFLLNTGMTENQLSEMNDLLKLEIYNSFKESNALDDDIEFKQTSTKFLSIGDEDGPNKRNIPESKLKIASSSFNNHQMGRLEVFGMFEWLQMPLGGLINNDSFSYAIDEGWDILPKSEALTLYYANGDTVHKFTRPSSGNKYGSTYRMATDPYKKFSQVEFGISHFSLRPNRNVPVTELSNYLEYQYVQDVSWLNSVSYSINIGPGTLNLNGTGSNIHEAFFRTRL